MSLQLIKGSHFRFHSAVCVVCCVCSVCLYSVYGTCSRTCSHHGSRGFATQNVSYNEISIHFIFGHVLCVFCGNVYTIDLFYAMYLLILFLYLRQFKPLLAN